MGRFANVDTDDFRAVTGHRYPVALIALASLMMINIAVVLQTLHVL